MLKEFGGDVNKGLAAYNAGPGAVSKAVAAAKDGNWLALLPKETQDYVVKVNKAYGDGTAPPAARPTLQDIHTELRARIGMGNPEKLRMALDESTRQYEETTKAVKQREDEGEAAALKWLAANGGKFSQLPPDLRSNIPPTKIDNVMTAAQKFAKGDDTTDPIVFQKMATDDAWLKGMSDAEFYSQSQKLSQSNREQMALRRGTLKNGAKGQSDKDLDYSAVNNLFNNRLAQMGRDPTPKDGSDDARQVGVQREVVWNAVMAAQLNSGKKFTDVDIANTIDSLFAKNITFRNTFLGFDTGKTNTPVLSLKPSDIPNDVREQLKKDFKARNVDATDQQLLGAYMRMRLRPQQPQVANNGR
jgi:soluble lytic murein transglycosylase